MDDCSAPIDWSFLIDREVNQIAVGMWQMQIHLSSPTDTISISLENRFEYDDQVWEEEAPLADRAAQLISLLGARSIDVQVEGDASLKVEFSNGHALRLFTRSDGYEAFSVSTGHGIYIILDKL